MCLAATRRRFPCVRSVPAADDDTSLAAALAAREPQAATIAWTRLSPLVLRLLRRYFGPGADRQDLCQEVFLRFFSRIDELRDQAALRSFLIGITLGVAQNEVRRAKVRRWIFLTQTGDLPDAPIAASDPEAREATVRFYQHSRQRQRGGPYAVRHPLRREDGGLPRSRTRSAGRCRPPSAGWRAPRAASPPA